MLKRVLIVDDSRLARLTLRRLLAKHQLEVHEVEGVLDAESWLSRNDLPDVVFMDIMMPHLDGYAGLARLRENPETRHIPVIMYSGDISEEARQKARDSGATGYLPKPAEASRLDNLLNSLSQRLDERSGGESASPSPETAARPAPAAASPAPSNQFGEAFAAFGKGHATAAVPATPAAASPAPAAAANNQFAQLAAMAAATVRLEEFKNLQQKHQALEQELQQLKKEWQQQRDENQCASPAVLERQIQERLQEWEHRLNHLERKPQLDGSSERQQRDVVFLQRQFAHIDKLAKIGIAMASVALLFSIINLVMQIMR